MGHLSHVSYWWRFKYVQMCKPSKVNSRGVHPSPTWISSPQSVKLWKMPSKTVISYKMLPYPPHHLWSNSILIHSQAFIKLIAQLIPFGLGLRICPFVNCVFIIHTNSWIITVHLSCSRVCLMSMGDKTNMLTVLE